MATYTYNKKLFVNVGVCNSNDYWNPFFEKNLINTRIKYKNHPFYYLKFPIHNLTKKAMLSIAKKNNFDDILNMTWSCWFPVNNKSCGKCPMCLERIIKHPAMF
jgi:7-cyano-7-deazaguanine synthase in queuosine biosynthesis